ncbi:MAG: tetratricopeptide repeat protein [Gallionellaceae bacterium]
MADFPGQRVAKLLQLALQHHQSGRLAEAEAQYRQILEMQPNHPDALHLSGLLAHQRGQQGTAVMLISKAIEANPVNPMYHNNLGLALKAQGKPDQAVRSYHQAMAIKADIAEVHYNLGVAYHDQGDLREAISSYRRALALRAEYAEAYCRLGNALQSQGDLAEAIISYRKALALKPGNIEVLNNMASALHKQGNLDEAISCLRTILSLRPDSTETHNNLGILLSRQGRLDDAVASFQRALSLKPDYAEAHNNLGITYREQGRLGEAIASYRRALAIRPDYVDALNNLGIQLQAQGDFAGAIESYRRVLAIKPGNRDVLFNLGYSLRNLGKLDDAVMALKQALSINPDFADAHVNLAAVYIDQGRFDDAQTSLSRALEIEPENHGALVMLTTSRKMTRDDSAWLETVVRLSADETLPLRKKYDLQFALGKYYDDIKQYDPAFAAYERANSLQRQLEGGFDRGKFTRLVDMLISTCNSEFIRLRQEGSSSSELPVLVVGMPRSGTSLIEQIIASHPQAFGAGELTFWLKWFEANQAALLSENLAGSLIANTASEYVQYLRRYSADALRIVDKMPSSFALLGLIHLIFPRAKIIHVRRNPVDTCLSVYFQNLSSSHSYGTDLDDLAYYYRQYDRMMQHWRRVLPADRFLELSYEALIDNQAEWSKRIIEFIGLEWSESCLDFHSTQRRVGTASNWQVRQKIYHSSRERWHNYEKHIGPLLELLDLTD